MSRIFTRIFGKSLLALRPLSLSQPNHCNVLVLEVMNLGKAGKFHASAEIVAARNLYYSASIDVRQTYKMCWSGSSERTLPIVSHDWAQLEVARIVQIFTGNGDGEIDINASNGERCGNLLRDRWRKGPDGPKPEFDLKIKIVEAERLETTTADLTIAILPGPQYPFDVGRFQLT